MNTTEKKDLRTTYNLEKIRSFFPEGFNFDIDDVFKACPYTFIELQKKSRLKDLVQWRQISMIFKYASGSTFEQVGHYFNKDHSTIVHSLKCVINALEGYDPVLKEKIDKIVSSSDVFIYSTDDHSKNLVLCLRYLEHNYAENFLTSSFYKSIRKVNNKVIR